MTLRITVPGVPQGKGRPRFSSRGGFARAYTPAKTVDYENAIADAAKGVMHGRDLIAGPVYLIVTALFPIPKSWPKAKRAHAASGLSWHTSKPDGDNILKCCGDALNGVVWKDDSQIAFSKVIKQYGERPGLDILVEVLP